jgi:hypothetical protein
MFCVLADLLWYTTEREVPVDAVEQLLSRQGEAWIGCGEYTTLERCESFMTLAETKGLTSRRIHLEDEWQGSDIRSLDNLPERKSTFWLWKMEWKTPPRRERSSSHPVPEEPLVPGNDSPE